jgi:hypothetical protein
MWTLNGVSKDFWNIQTLEHVDIEERKKDISFIYFLAEVLDGMRADHSVDVSGGLSITAKAGPLDPTAICVGETARLTEAWQELPFKSALNKNKQPIHKEKEKQRSWLVFMFCCKTSRKSNKTVQTKPEISFPLSSIYLHV